MSPRVPTGMFHPLNDTGAAPVMVASFRLDKYEVSVGRMRQFVTQGMGTQAKPPLDGAGMVTGGAQAWRADWNAALPVDTAALTSNFKCDSMLQTWTDDPGANETRPINCVSWYVGFAFCAWDGGFLPSNEQLWYARVGGGGLSGQREYPWSNPPDQTTINSSYASYGDGTQCLASGTSRACVRDDIIAVGSKPMGNGAFGQADLVGNVWEWVGGGTTPVETFIVGGSYGSKPDELRAHTLVTVNAGDSTTRVPWLGFRCAR
jgi:sulfatase modifying factor 1